ncbi:hypothetical protein CXB77_05965 [Chromatium okenii]|uniref:Uncharacterized protein n=1 Tax=Chromatium okenii TaxID=61644 RepID=A0A2S7XSS8_9GAMM|nr:hypothetical protein CXB77_05965 [Chromatium okenii]
MGWINDSTLAGWNLFNSTGAAITTYSADNGISNTGGFKSFGANATAPSAVLVPARFPVGSLSPSPTPPAVPCQALTSVSMANSGATAVEPIRIKRWLCSTASARPSLVCPLGLRPAAISIGHP